VNNEFPLVILETLCEKMPLESLQEFTLRRRTDSLQGNPLNDSVANPGKILQFITNLSISGARGYPLILSAEEFKNLSNLHLTFSQVKETDEEISQLARLQHLPKLKKLTFSFPARSFFSQRKFLENFSLPPTLEFLDLKLENFTWSEVPVTNENRKMTQQIFENDPLYVQFFNRLQNNSQNTKVLNLRITRGFHCPALTGKFASLFIQQFSKLETLSYQNQSTRKPTDTLAKPLNFEDFWKGLESSKETLTSISIDAPEIILPEMINSILEARFPRLQSLSFKERIISHPELNLFCQTFPSLKQVLIQDVMFPDEEKLNEFLLSWRETSQEMNVDLHLNVQNIQQQNLIECLMRYIEEVKVKGKFKIYLRDIQVQDVKAFQGILKLAQEKGYVETFRLTSQKGKIVFCIHKGNLLRAANKLTS